MEHISTVGAPGEIKLGDELDIWDGFKDTDNNPANEDSIILSLKDSVKAVIQVCCFFRSHACTDRAYLTAISCPATHLSFRSILLCVRCIYSSLHAPICCLEQKTRRSNWDFMLKNMDRLRAHSRLETMKEKLAKTGDLLSMAAAHDTAEVNATNAVMEKRRSRSMSLAAGQEAMQSLMQAAMGGRARSHSIDQQEFKVGATIPTVRRDSMTRGGDGAVASGAISERSQSEERPNTSNSHPVRSRGSKEPAARKAAPNKKAPAKKPVKKVKKKAPVRPATPSSSDEEEETSLGSLSSDSDEDEPQRKHGHSEVVSKKVDRVVFDSRSSLPKTRSWRPVTPTTPITPAPSATAPSFADVLVIGPVPSTAHSSRRASATLSNTGRPVTPVIPSSLGVAR